MKKQFNLLQLFSLVDGRLSTSMDDIYDMLNHILDEDLFTHHLPVAMRYIREKNPSWFKDVADKIEAIKVECKSDDFEKLINFIKKHHNDTYNIPQMKDEFNVSGFGSYMINNSLLFK